MSTHTVSMGIYLSDDRHDLMKSVSVYYNQSYTLAMRFEGRQSGWSLTNDAERAYPPAQGYLGRHNFTRSGFTSRATSPSLSAP